MELRELLASLRRDLGFFLRIYTWSELWILVASCLGMVGSWVVVAYAFSLPNPFRSIIIWIVVFVLAVLVPKALVEIPKKE